MVPALYSSPVSHQSEEKTHHGVDTPWVKAPVVEGEQDGLLGEAVVRQGVVRREPVGTDGVVVDGLRHAEEEDPGADTTGEQHAEPGNSSVTLK